MKINHRNSPQYLNRKLDKIKMVCHHPETLQKLKKINKMMMMMRIFNSKNKNKPRELMHFNKIHSFKAGRLNMNRSKMTRFSSNKTTALPNNPQSKSRSQRSQNFLDQAAANFIRLKTHVETVHTLESLLHLQFYKDASSLLLPYFSGNLSTLPFKIMIRLRLLRLCFLLLLL